MTLFFLTILTVHSNEECSNVCLWGICPPVCVTTPTLHSSPSSVTKRVNQLLTCLMSKMKEMRTKVTMDKNDSESYTAVSCSE